MGSKCRFIIEAMFLGCSFIFHKIWGYKKTAFLLVRFTMKEECCAGTKVFSVADPLHKIKAYSMVWGWLQNIAQWLNLLGLNLQVCCWIIWTDKSLWKVAPSSMISLMTVPLHSVRAFYLRLLILFWSWQSLIL